MTAAEQARLEAYLETLRPKAMALREEGWPVEIRVDMDELVMTHPAVSLILDLGDTRRPIEAV